MQRSSDALTRLVLSHDASRFLEVPEEVVVASCAEDVAALFAEATHHRRHLTLRGGGTSLSGQGVTDGILVDVRRRFRDVEVLDEGLRVRAGAGATVAQVNAQLKKYGRRLGPDPASAQAATIGGIVANNSTGKLCGIADDPFHTIDSLVAVLPSGRIIDTAHPDADVTLTWDEPRLAGGLAILRRRLRDDPKSLDQIARLWSMRNAMGYQLRALTDYAKPSDILRQIMVGSEGTLGFIAEATFRTVPLAKHQRSDLILFPTLDDALDAAAQLVEYGFDAVELFDVDAIRVMQSLPSSHEALQARELDDQAALLVELHSDSASGLAEREQFVQPLLDSFPEVHEVALDARKAPLWRVHHGIHTAMAMGRDAGTTLLMEDFSVPRERLAETIRQLNKLFDRYGFERSAITGQLTDCTLHFMLTENFEDPERLRKFRRFVQGFVKMVLAHGGILKAQHGTGRVMAPFLEQQVGVELFDVMKEVKHLFDPLGILSPGVMFNENPDAHVTNIKLMPTVDEPIDRCIECGLCENVCPSSDLTLTPRQRIVLQREIAVRGEDRRLMAAVAENYVYAAIDTCSTASMCKLACPLGIDIGEFVRDQRGQAATPGEEHGWDRAARNWDTATRVGATVMTAADRVRPLAKLAINYARTKLGGEQIWDYSDRLPRGSVLRRRPRAERTARDPVAAYFPGCQQTFLGAASQGVYGAFNELCTRAGVAVSLLNASAMCCGLPWTTRGLHAGYKTMSSKVRRALAPRSDETIVIDSSACARSLEEMLGQYPGPRPEIVDVVPFVVEHLLPELTVTKKFGSLLLYPSCANKHLGNLDATVALASAIADEVVVPASWNCCGGHSDRGLLHPEVPRAATRLPREEILARSFDAYASTTRSCEVAMSIVTDRTFVHVLELVAEATR